MHKCLDTPELTKTEKARRTNHGDMLSRLRSDEIVPPRTRTCIDHWYRERISTVEYVYNTIRRPPFIAADGNAEKQPISESSHESCSVGCVVLFTG